MQGNLVGAIDMHDKYTFVEVPREYAADVIEAMKHAKDKRKKCKCRTCKQEIKIYIQKWKLKK